MEFAPQNDVIEKDVNIDIEMKKSIEQEKMDEDHVLSMIRVLKVIWKMM